MLTDIMEYDLTGMAGEICEILNGEGIGPLTGVQRRKLYKVIEKYAKRAIKIITDNGAIQERAAFFAH